MKIKLFQFNKKINSTKRPTDGTEFTITLKEGCDIINPTINLAGVNNPTAYNYAYIPDFKRYYYISNWEANRDRWTASMAVDVLASYKDQIGESTQYVTRSTSEKNGKLPDSLDIFEQSKITLNGQLDGPLYVTRPEQGTYVVCISTLATTRFGAPIYAMGFSGFQSLWTALNQITVSDIFTGEALDYVLWVRWYPIPWSRFSGLGLIGEAESTLPVGKGFINNLDGVHPLVNPVYVTEEVFDLSTMRHPQASIYGEYMNGSPYTEYSLVMPPFGVVNIDSTNLVDSDNVKIRLAYDFSGGSITMSLLNQLTNVLGYYVNVFGVTFNITGLISNIQLPTVTVPPTPQKTPVGKPQVADPSSAVSTAKAKAATAKAEAAATAARWTGNVAAGVAGGIAIGVTAGVQLLHSPFTSITEGHGTVCVYEAIPRIIGTYNYIANPNPDIGRPLCETRKISDVPGYVVISDPHFEITMTDTEMSALNGAASSGFFYE